MPQSAVPSSAPTPTPPTAPQPQNSQEAINAIRTGGIIGGVIGGAALIAVVVLVVFWIRRRHPKPPKDEENRHRKGSMDGESAPPEYSTDGEWYQAAHRATMSELEHPREQPPGVRRHEVDAVGGQVHEMPAALHELPEQGSKTHQESTKQLERKGRAAKEVLFSEKTPTEEKNKEF